MGQFTIKSKRNVDSKALEASVTISDDDINRITLAYAKIYFPNGVEVPGTPEIPGTPAIAEVLPTEEVLDEEGNVLVPANPGSPAIPAVPAVPAVPSTYREPTGQEIFDAIANGLLNGILNNTVAQERSEAAKSAQESVAPIILN